jgi:hypothetical protein
MAGVRTARLVPNTTVEPFAYSITANVELVMISCFELTEQWFASCHLIKGDDADGSCQCWGGTGEGGAKISRSQPTNGSKQESYKIPLLQLRYD